MGREGEEDKNFNVIELDNQYSSYARHHVSERLGVRCRAARRVALCQLPEFDTVQIIF